MSACRLFSSHLRPGFHVWIPPSKRTPESSWASIAALRESDRSCCCCRQSSNEHSKVVSITSSDLVAFTGHPFLSVVLHTLSGVSDVVFSSAAFLLSHNKLVACCCSPPSVGIWAGTATAYPWQLQAQAVQLTRCTCGVTQCKALGFRWGFRFVPGFLLNPTFISLNCAGSAV